MSTVAESLKQARDSIQQAYRLVSRGEHEEAFLKGEKELKVARITHRTTLEAVKLLPGSYYESNLYKSLGHTLEKLDDFREGHGWNCLQRALDDLSDALDELAKHS